MYPVQSWETEAVSELAALSPCEGAFATTLMLVARVVVVLVAVASGETEVLLVQACT